jgi:hypothetical protein
MAVQAVADGTDVAAATGLSPRHVDYHLQTGRVLGWLSQDPKHPVVTSDGQALLDTAPATPEEKARMRSAVESSAVVKSVVPRLFDGLSVDEIADLLAESPLTKLAASTARKRAAALVRWRAQVAPVSSSASVALAGNAAQLSSDRILLLHLSDIHLRTSTDLERLLTRAPLIAAAVAARPDSFGVDLCCVAISGDVAFSGKRAEYEMAQQFLNALCSQLRERLSGVPIHVLIVPGNHDCNFDEHHKMREKLIANVDPAEVDQSYVSGCVGVQQAFWTFCDSWHDQAQRERRELPALTIHDLLVGTKRLRFQLLNTAWMSTLRERQGALVFPQGSTDALGSSTAPAELVVSICHHGYNWLEANNARSLRSAIERTSDVVLTGHEHVAEHFSKSGSSGQSSWHVEGGVLSDSDDSDHSTFNTVVLDLAQSELKITTLSWEPAENLYKPERDYTPCLFQRNQYRLRSEFQPTPQFAAVLDDPGEPYQHPRRSPVRLSDLYVYPDLKERLYERTGIDAERVVRDPVEYVLTEQNVMLFAPEMAGKTALSRALFVDLHRRGFVPILIDGRDLGDPSGRAVHAAIDEAFRRGYDGHLLERFRQLETAKRAIIIDDFHRSPLNIRAKDEAVAVFAAFADIVVMMVDETFEVAAISGQLDKASKLWGFAHCSVLPLGHRLRYDLVARWCTLGRGHTDDPDVESREAERKDRAVTHLIGQNFLPYFASFVLLCLQQLELKTQESNLGSFGHLYEALLTRSLIAGGSGSGMDLDAKQHFLTELAFHIFTSEDETIGASHFAEAFQKYCDVFHVTFPRERVEKELVASNTLQFRAGRYAFRYKYAFLFFLARYIRDHIEDESTKDIIRRLCTRLHHEPSANTLMFLCHLSKHSFVLDTLLSAARSLFPGEPELELDSALTPLISNPRPRPLELPSGDHHQNRRDERDLMDRYNAGSEIAPQADGMPREVMDISAAFKTVQILGQVLRGFPGSIPGDRKLEIATECYSLGLRSSQALISMIMGAHNEIAEILESVVSSRRPGLRDEKLKQAAHALLYDLCEAMCFGAIQHVSDAVGLQTLARTYEEVLRRDNKTAFQVIDLAVRLDHFDEFPQSRLDSLLRDTGNKVLPMNLVRRLVWRHIYLFPLPKTQVQSLCSKLDIRYSRALESSGKRRRD